MNKILLFEEFEINTDELDKHTHRINNILSSKEYKVNIKYDGVYNYINADVNIKYKSENTEENYSYIKVDIKKDKYIEFRTYMNTNNSIELSVYKDWGILLDKSSIEDIISIYDDIKDYIGLSESQITNIRKNLISKLLNNTDHLNFEFKI